MKIAIIHDWLVTNGGAEKVLKSMLELYPTADIFSIVDFLSLEDREEILNNRVVKTSFIQKLPFAKKYFRNYLFLFPKAIESFDLSSYSLIISSSWAFAKGVQKSSDQFHICYCYTPIRYVWDLQDTYTSNLNKIKKFIVKLTLDYIAKWDIRTLDRVDFFIADSKFVQERILRIYGRSSIVIYPPVDIEKFKLNLLKEDFYLTVSRLVSYKKIKLIVEAFNKMPDKKLVVIGEGVEYKEIKEVAKDNVEVLGYQSMDTIVYYMQRAKAFMYVAVEDFGIVTIEAMSCGTPVIALNQGGTKETVKDMITGIHFHNQDMDSIINAVEKFENINFDYKFISDEAKKYTNFKIKFKKVIDYYLKML
jgi:glycosyltransferase involved in cell wall biosynthesis